jgi:hypothetical protein
MAKKASAKPQLPIAEVMSALDRRDGNYYSRLDDEKKKQLSTYMAQRWGSQVQGDREIQEYYLTMINDLSNIDYVATTSDHEEMRWRVLALCGLGQKMRHEFVPPKGRKKDKIAEWLSDLYPNLSDDEIDLFRTVNDSDVLADAAQQMNVTQKKVKDIFG